MSDQPIPSQAEANEDFYRRNREEGHVAKFIAQNLGKAEKSTARIDDRRKRWELEGSAGDPPGRQLAPIEIDYLIDMDIPEPAALVGTLLREGSLGMVHAPAGTAKTFFMLSLAVSLKYGVPFLGYPVASTASALYLDGEMASYDMKKRSTLLSAPMKAMQAVTDKRLFIVTPDLHPDGIPKVDTQEGADALMSLLNLSPEIKLVVIDNLACLTCPDGDDSHGAKSFNFVQDLMLRLRSRNIACWLVHHSGKDGNQRGTSKRADVLDVVIRLTPMPLAGDGRTEITVAFEKGRHMRPEDKTDFVACLESNSEGPGLIWTRSQDQIPIWERVRSMLASGMPPGDIANELKCNRSYVYRLKDEMAEAGELRSRKAKKAVSRAGDNEVSDAGDKTGRQRGRRGRQERHEYA